MSFNDSKENLLVYDISLIANHSHLDTHHGKGHQGSTILFIFLSCLIGALIRSLLKGTHIPFTVIIFVLGCATGILSALFESFSKFTLLAEMDPHLMLHIFLPVLVFDSAYALETHTLIKSFPQCILLAVPGFMLNAALAGILVRTIFPYGWPWSVSLCFGALSSATDPIAVVSLLKELGTDKKLSILIEGESLLNDGAALVLFTVFLQMARGEYVDDGTFGVVAIFFLRVLFGGLAIGYILGKTCSTWLSKVYNDAIVETIITIAFPYITYYLAEAVFGVSGVLSVVVLGAVLSSERTSISPEVEKFLNKQWNLLAFSSNTLIFVLVGIVIAEQAIKEVTDQSSYSKSDWFYIGILYIGTQVIRGFTLLILSPILRRLGYGFDWPKAIVMWWGGLRGAVSLALALLVAQDDILDPHDIGSKVLLHAAGLVVLTLVINGCTMSTLLGVLGLTQITVSKKSAMSNAVTMLQETQTLTIETLKADRFLADAHWDVVKYMSKIENPYHHRTIKASRTMRLSRVSALPESPEGPDSELPLRTADLTLAQYREYENEARIRYLKAQKISYWRQFERGMVGRAAVRKLMDLTESAADKDGKFITLADINVTWKLRGFMKMFPQLSTGMKKACKVLTKAPAPKPDQPSQLYKVVSARSFRNTFYGFLLLQFFGGIADLLLLQYKSEHQLPFLIFTTLWTTAYIVEFLLKVTGLGIKIYFTRPWNVVTFLSLLAAAPELYFISMAPRFMDDGDRGRYYHWVAAIIRVSRCVRLGELLVEGVLPAIQKFIERRIEARLHFGYDVGRGFVVGEEECRGLIHHIAVHPDLREKFKNQCDKNRLAVIKELALLQRTHPGVAVSVKTRQAARSILNRINETLLKITDDGLIDQGEADHIKRNIDKQIKRLVAASLIVPPIAAENMLTFVPWLQGVDFSIAKFMHERAQLINFDHGDTILQQGEAPKGIFIIVSGLVKILGRVRLHSRFSELADSDDKGGQAASERYTDYLSAGAVLGEMGPLMDKQQQVTVTAETAVQLFYLSITDLEMAFDMYPDVKLRLWKDCAIRVVLGLLTEQPGLKDMSKEAARLFLEQGYIPTLREETTYHIDEGATYTFLVHGQVSSNSGTGLEQNYKAPCLLPRDVKLVRFNDPYETILFLLPVEDYPLKASDSVTDHMRIQLKTFASKIYKALHKKVDGGDGDSKKRKLTLKDITEMLIVKKMLRRRGTQDAVTNGHEENANNKETTETNPKQNEVTKSPTRQAHKTSSLKDLQYSTPVLREAQSENLAPKLVRDENITRVSGESVIIQPHRVKPRKTLVKLTASKKSRQDFNLVSMKKGDFTLQQASVNGMPGHQLSTEQVADISSFEVDIKPLNPQNSQTAGTTESESHITSRTSSTKYDSPGIEKYDATNSSNFAEAPATSVEPSSQTVSDATKSTPNFKPTQGSSNDRE